MKKYILLCMISLTLHSEQEKKPRYTKHTGIGPDGKEYTYLIDHSPEAKAKIDAQFAPSHKPDTRCLGY